MSDSDEPAQKEHGIVRGRVNRAASFINDAKVIITLMITVAAASVAGTVWYIEFQTEASKLKQDVGSNQETINSLSSRLQSLEEELPGIELVDDVWFSIGRNKEDIKALRSELSALSDEIKNLHSLRDEVDSVYRVDFQYDPREPDANTVEQRIFVEKGQRAFLTLKSVSGAFLPKLNVEVAGRTFEPYPGDREFDARDISCAVQPRKGLNYNPNQKIYVVRIKVPKESPAQVDQRYHYSGFIVVMKKVSSPCVEG